MGIKASIGNAGLWADLLRSKRAGGCGGACGLSGAVDAGNESCGPDL